MYGGKVSHIYPNPSPTRVRAEIHGEQTMPRVRGQCLCGQVTYTAIGAPLATFLGHCRQCQRYTGSAFEAGMIFPVDSVSISGELTTFVHRGGSTQSVRRRFCSNCGSGVVNELDAIPGAVIVLAGTLDDPSAFNPKVEVFCLTVQPWVQLNGDRQRFTEGRDSARFP